MCTPLPKLDTSAAVSQARVQTLNLQLQLHYRRYFQDCDDSLKLFKTECGLEFTERKRGTRVKAYPPEHGGQRASSE